MNKLNILIFSKRPFHNSPRIIREIDALKYDFNIYCIGETEPTEKSVMFRNIYEFRTIPDRILYRVNYVLKNLLAKKLVIARYSKLKKFIFENNISILIIHEPFFLPEALKLKKIYKVKIIFNAHEYHPLEFEDQPDWLNTIGKVYEKLYRQYLPKLDLLINVCHGISEKCKKEFNVSSIVIPNAASYSDIAIHNNVTTEKIKMIYHGAIMESRKIEEMIEVMKILGLNYSLDIMGTSIDFNREYYNKLLNIIEDMSNVRFREPVKFEVIIPTINSYDIGIYILNPNGFNNEYALPNKLYEYMQAKLAIAISPSTEMKRLVEKYDLGVVADGFTPESLAAKIKRLTKHDILKFKKNSEVASKIENAGKYKELYLSQIKTLLE